MDSKILTYLVSDIKKYKVLDNDFHSGHLYEHTVWVILYSDLLFSSQSKWIEGIPNTTYFRTLISFSAFFHDIGKAGDLQYNYLSKTNHSQIGFDYLQGNIPYLTNSGPVSIRHVLNKLAHEFNLDDLSIETIKYVCLLHWDFGAILRDYSQNLDLGARKYLNNVKQNIQNMDLNRKSFGIFIRILILISVCDVLGTRPINSLGTSCQMIPQLTKGKRAYIGINAYEKYKYDTNGYLLRQKILALI